MSRASTTTARLRVGWRLAAAGAATALTAVGLVAASAAPASATTTCGSTYSHKTNQGTFNVQKCPIWKSGTPVFASPSNHTVVGQLNAAGSGNWFVDQQSASTYSGFGYTSSWWAYTEADNGKWGYVSGIYFAGSSSQWTGLRVYTDPCTKRTPRCD